LGVVVLKSSLSFAAGVVVPAPTPVSASASASAARPSTAPSVPVAPGPAPLPAIVRSLSSSSTLVHIPASASHDHDHQQQQQQQPQQQQGQPSPNSRPTRPSLSEQLAAIGSKAEALTQDIRQKAGLPTDVDGDQPLFVVPTRALVVGTLSCRFPSPARFYRDRIEYTFHHPFEALEVEMRLYYKDLLQPAMVGGRLKFKLPRRLVHFLSDFDPSNPNHNVSIELGSSFLRCSP